MPSKSRAVLPFLAVLAVSGCASNEPSSSKPIEIEVETTVRASDVIASLRTHPGLTVELDPRLSLLKGEGGLKLGSIPPHAGFRAAGYGFLDATLPERANESLRLVRRGFDDFVLEITPLDLEEVQGEVVHGAIVFAHALPGTDVIHAASGAGVEELRVLRSDDANAVLRYRVHLGPAVADLRVVASRLEALDAEGYARIATAEMIAIDARGTKRSLVVAATREGRDAFVTATLDARGLARPVVIDPMWEAGSSLGTPREEPTATVLLDGKVLAAGGMNGFSASATAEIYTSSSSSWASTGSMKGARRFHAAALTGTKVLAAGGYLNSGTSSALSTAEVYDTAAKTWSDAPDMTAARAAHTATTLTSGEVLIVGGEQGSTILSSAQRYVPSTNSWKSTASMAVPRTRHTATRLADGKVIVIGGRDASTVLTGAELYDPATDTWTTVGGMKTARWSHTAHTLPDGSVLVVGGFYSMDKRGADNAERYVPVGKTFAPIDATMNRHRGACFSATLGNGRIVTAGGLDFDGTFLLYRGVSQIFGAATEQWTDSDSLTGGRGSGATVALDAARALAIGGSELGVSTSKCDLFTLIPDGQPCLPAGGFEYRCANFCVDLVCCTTTCEDACSSCATTAGVGKCLPVADGPPVAPRSCGAYTRCFAGKCATTCKTDDECIASHFCSGGACIPRKAIGISCSTAGECGSRNCIDGVCCDTACDKACEACNLPGKLGECSAVLDGTTPPHDPKACSPYVCGASGCRTSCTNQGHCIGSARCVDGACVNRTVECSGDGLASIDWSTGSGLATSCGAYRCGNDGRCRSACGGTGDCAPDYVCNLTARTCVPGDRPSSGCGMSASSREDPPNDLAWLVVAGIVSVIRRWRRR